MCGICGSTSNAVKLKHALQEMSHRGPDGSGTYVTESISLGHVLLAIQDPGNAKQPMRSRTGKSVMTYNGEVYNHLELRSELPGFQWKSNSDSETVVELLEKFGSQITSKFRGMFAIALWDVEDKSLHLFRDYYGEKPLYYCIEKSGDFHFSSEVRNLASLCKEKMQFSPRSIAHFLKYLYFDPIDSIYSGIKSVPPGTEMRIKNNEIRSMKIIEQSPEVHPQDDSNLRDSVMKAVGRTLLSDVPVGIMLSGGIDSTIITSIAAVQNPGIPTFTLRRDRDDEDVRFAQLAANKFGTNHHEIEVDLSSLHEDIYYALSKASQPFADTSLIPTYLLSKYASKYVKVLISGDGADELFGGYSHYEMYRTASIGSQSLRKYIYKQAKWEILRRSRSKNIRKYFYEANIAALESRHRTFGAQWNKDSTILTDGQIKQILNKEFSISKYSEESKGNPQNLRDILDLDLKSYLPADILFKSDTAGMLASVEIRAPFLDLDLREVRNRLDLESLGDKKSVLVQAFKDDIPQEVISRRKVGFGAPVDIWFAQAQVREMADEIIKDKSNGMYDFMNYNEVQRVIASSGNLCRWEMLTLAIWIKENG